MHVQYLAFTKKRAFGVELELLKEPLSQAALRHLICQIDGHRDVLVTGWKKTTRSNIWHVKTDSSCGFEIASFKAKGAKDLLLICKVADIAKQHGGKVDVSCGLHVHVDCSDLSKSEAAAIVSHWTRLENVINSILPLHRISNPYCKSLSSHYMLAQADFATTEKFWKKVCPAKDDNEHRRVNLNICNYVHNEKNRKTFEFRMPEGTLDSYEIRNWVRFLVNFIHVCRHKRLTHTNRAYTLEEAVMILGLHQSDREFVLLSNGLRETKEWFLRRVLTHGSSEKGSAVSLLNQMWEPYRRYQASGEITQLRPISFQK